MHPTNTVSDLSYLFIAVIMTTAVEVYSNFVQFQYSGMAGRHTHTNSSTSDGQLFYNTPTAIACARLCFDLGNNCDNFLWDPNTNNCSLGPTGHPYNNHNPVLAPTPGQAVSFKKTFPCLFSLGYEFIFSGTTPILCVQMLNDGKTRAEAESVCNSLKGHLVVTDTLDKIQAVDDLAKERFPSFRFVCVGANDEVDEGIFVWSSGRPLTPEEYGFFCATEPNGGADENWLSVRIGDRCFNDYKFRTGSVIFVCEMKTYNNG